MQTSIFGKPLNTVTFADVVDFCNGGTKEGLSLDYKRDLSSLEKVVKCLVSFANTNGGWIIVGVDDDNDKPKPPFEGYAYTSNIDEKRIMNAIISQVSPIVLPYFQLCEKPTTGKAFMILYMPQSPSAPHWMNYKGQNMLFIRVADRAKGEDWERSAKPEEYELLRNRREQSVELRKNLIDQLKSIYKHHCIDTQLSGSSKQSASFAAGFISQEPTNYYLGSLTITLAPLYPSSPVSSCPEIHNQLTMPPLNNSLDSRFTPDRGSSTVQTYQNGAYIYRHEESNVKHSVGQHSYFCGLDIHGTLLNVDPIEYLDQNRDASKVNPFTIIIDIESVLAAGNKYYTQLGLVGNIMVDISFDGLPNCKLICPPEWDMSLRHNTTASNITGNFRVHKETDTTTLTDTTARNKLVVEIITEIMYSFNFPDFPKATIEKWVQNNGNGRISVAP